MTRLDTDRTILHDEACCEACRERADRIREVQVAQGKDMEREQEFGKVLANRVTGQDSRLDTLEKQRARTEGREEVLDQVAREKAASANSKANVAGWAAGLALVITTLAEVLPGVLKAIKSMGG